MKILPHSHHLCSLALAGCFFACSLQAQDGVVVNPNPDGGPTTAPSWTVWFAEIKNWIYLLQLLGALGFTTWLGKQMLDFGKQIWWGDGLEYIRSKIDDLVTPDSKELDDELKKQLKNYYNRLGLPPARPADYQQKPIVAVISGKGGVGKSTLSLGITEFLAAQGGVALLDLDMPNRGITSLISARKSGQKRMTFRTSLFDELTWFHAETVKAAEAIGNKIDESGEPRGKRGKLPDRELKLNRLPDQGRVEAKNQAKAKDTKTTMTILPSNAYLLPSIKPVSRYLGTSVFGLPAEEIQEFIHDLERRMPATVARIVLDCHGAHDMLMVGSIQAATDLIITTTPEPGGFDGTYDLVSFALSQVQFNQTRSITLLINNVARWQRSEARALEAFFNKTLNEAAQKNDASQTVSPPHSRVFIVYSNSGVRRIMGRYFLGEVSKSKIWKTICEIGEIISSPDEVADSPDLTQSQLGTSQEHVTDNHDQAGKKRETDKSGQKTNS